MGRTASYLATTLAYSWRARAWRAFSAIFCAAHPLRFGPISHLYPHQSTLLLEKSKFLGKKMQTSYHSSQISLPMTQNYWLTKTTIATKLTVADYRTKSQKHVFLSTHMTQKSHLRLKLAAKAKSIHLRTVAVYLRVCAPLQVRDTSSPRQCPGVLAAKRELKELNKERSLRESSLKWQCWLFNWCIQVRSRWWRLIGIDCIMSASKITQCLKTGQIGSQPPLPESC